MDDIIACFTYFGKRAGQDAGRIVEAGSPGVFSRIVYEPVGVCGLISPWNYPLLQSAWKVAPALAAGNTFVLKPSELTPHTAMLLMGVLAEVGLPAGVANLVLGAGAVAGAPLSEPPGCGLGVVHRRTGHRQTRSGRRGGHRQEGGAGTRRQESERDLRRRPLRRRGGQRPERCLRQLRAGVLGRRALDRSRGAERPLRR